jgi:hypothetical protein
MMRWIEGEREHGEIPRNALDLRAYSFGPALLGA